MPDSRYDYSFDAPGGTGGQAEMTRMPKTHLAKERERIAGNTMNSQPGEGAYEDFHGAGGWGYRLFPDANGEISENSPLKIIYAPEGHKSGAKLDGGPAHEAIMLEHAAFKATEAKEFAAKPRATDIRGPDPAADQLAEESITEAGAGDEIFAGGTTDADMPEGGFDDLGLNAKPEDPASANSRIADLKKRVRARGSGSGASYEDS